MALTRKQLKGMGLGDEVIDAIIDAHTETVDGLKNQIERYKQDADALPGVRQELEALKSTGGDWKEKYEKEHSDFETYKTAQTEREKAAKVTDAYKALLIKTGVPEKHVGKIVRLTDMSAYQLAEDGSITDSDKVAEAIKAEWGDYIPTQETYGAPPANPPAGNPPTELDKMSDDEYYKTVLKKGT